MVKFYCTEEKKMFRKMRLEENMTSNEEAVEMLNKATNGVLAVLGGRRLSLCRTAELCLR